MGVTCAEKLFLVPKRKKSRIVDLTEMHKTFILARAYNSEFGLKIWKAWKWGLDQL